MHQRVVSSRSRQPKREKIFRATKDENNSSEKRKTEFKQRGLFVTSSKPISNAVSTHAANNSTSTDNTNNITTFNNSSRVPVILCKPAFRGDCRPTVTRSRSRDAPLSFSSCRNEPFRKRLDSDLFPLSHHAKSSPGDPLKVLDFHEAGFCDNLTKLLRCILYEEDRDRRLTSAGQLREHVHSPDFNIGASSGFRIAQELTKLLLERNPQELKEEVVECVGAISVHLKDNTRRFLDWLFEKYETVPNDEHQILLLRVLLEALRRDEDDACFSAHMPSIMSSIQCTLENTDAPMLLRAIVDVVSTISERYPEIFRDHFRDTVDILVGWHIDPTQSETIVNYTSEALVSFHSFWVVDLPFSMTLLGQFLEDVEAYSEEMACFPGKEDDETENSASDYSAKIASLIRVYTTVVKSLGEHFEPENNPTITVEFISENLSRLLSSVMAASSELIWTDLLIAANDCVGLLAIHLRACTATHLQMLLAFVQVQTGSDSDLTTPLLISIVHLLTQVVKACGVHLPLGFVTQILGPGAMWPTLRLKNHVELNGALTELYAAVFKIRDVPLLEESYKCVLSDLKTAFLHLFDWKLDIPTPEPVGILDNDHSAIVDIIFCLRAVSEVGNDKTSLIGMMALNPSVFCLLTHHLKPTDRTMGLRYPIVQFAILSTLYSHCSRHGQFVCSSSLTSPTLSVTDRPTTSGHLTVVVELLTKILREQAHCYDTRILALRWSYAVFDSLKSLLPQLCNSGPINALLQALLAVGFGNTCDGKVCANVGRSFCLVMTMAGHNLTRSVIKKCHELCLLNLSHEDNSVQDVYMELFALLPLDGIISPLSVTSGPSGQCSSLVDSESVQGLCSVWQGRRYLQSRTLSGMFRSTDFRSVMSFLLLGNQLDSESVAEIFHACRRMEKSSNKPEEKLLSSLVTSHKGMLWFWATYECAFLCITTKLRTPLGKPQETFTAIELAVKSLASDAAVGHPSDGKLGQPYDPVNVLSSRLRAQLLLSFLEHLEKLLYNAYEGCALSIAGTPKAVKTFFRTNKATCQEWMHRVRRAAMTLALKTGHPALVVHHGYHFLAAFKDANVTKDSEFFHSLLLVVQALVELKSPDAILGLYAWCRKRFDLRLTWIKVSVDLGAGRYEAAAHEFKAILAPLSGKKAHGDEEDSLAPVLGFAGQNNKLESHIIDYMKSQVLECYRRLGSWSELCDWLEQQRNGDKNDGCVPWISTVNESHLRAMASFDASCASGGTVPLDFHDASSSPNNEIQGPLSNFGMFCRQVESVLLGLQTKAGNIMDKELDDVKKKLNFVGDVLKLSAMEWPPCLPSELASLHHTALKMRKFDDDQQEMKSTNEFSWNVTDDMDCTLLLQALRWNCGFHSQKRIVSAAGGIEDLYLGVVRLARKQHNLKLSQQLLQHRSLIDAGLTSNSITDEGTRTGFSVSKTKWCQERAKLLYSLDNKSQAVKILSATISAALANIHQNQETFSYSVKGQTVSELGSRCLMNLVKWLQIDGSLASFLPAELCGESFKLYSNGWCLNSTGNDWNVLPVTIREGHGTEEMIGRLLWLGTAQCPWLEKAWSSYASWCYKAGKKTVDMAMESGFELLADDEDKICALLPKDHKDRDFDTICKIICDPCNATLAMSSDSSNDQDFTDPIRQALLAVPSLDSDNVAQVLDIVQGIVKRLYTLYHLAARGYFAYLKLSAGSISAFEGSEVFEEGSVTATLRLLRLMVKHATELRDVIEVGLAQTPTKPWRGIIPQLFSRLHHPEPYVRQSISDLLCRVAIDAPHLIIFPAVVGSSAPRIEPKETSGLLGECLSEHSDDELEDKCDCEDPCQYGVISLAAAEEENQQKATILQNCFASMVDTLAKEEPRSVSEVQKMVHELRRITLLWDEFWVGTLGQYQADFSRRVAQLEKEVQKVKANSALVANTKSLLILKKHQTFLKPMIYVMEQLQQVTCQQPETQHEQWFRDTFGPLIGDVLFKLKNPTNPEHPQTSWQIYRQLHHALQQGVQRRSGLLLNMSQISPILASMKSSMIAMPGAVMRPGQIITIQSIEDNIAILPTKTKPKKLVFLGSDGKRYTFLFKGLEDLHLDERIMQLLMIINGMFVKLLKKGHSNFSARHYAVTPLGLRSGLIQWVDGATPLFGLYKRWQQREVVAQALRSASSGVNLNPTQGTLLRPSEIYYNKLAPLLKERGITNFENRKEWPLSIQRKVLSELMAETPSDLLARELWAASTSAAEWWAVTQRYAQSTAVMSVIGYIIGLGDRHLDNVLVDLATGEVVHIDYNVCFEKGRNLRVPEKVPFRMTPNIEMALGVTGVEGAFRVSCERVLKMLRHGRETLLTLLEAFVYDPLIDWTPGNEGGYTGAVYGGWQGGAGMAVKRSRHDMEKEVTVEMLNIRMAEMKSQWLENREELLTSLPDLESQLQTWIDAQQSLLVTEDDLQEFHQQMAFLKEAEANAAHPLHSLDQRYRQYLVVQKRLQVVRASVESKLAESQSKHLMHKNALDAVKGPELSHWCHETRKGFTPNALTYPPAVEFLYSAGQSQLLQQCEQSEKDLSLLVRQLQGLLQSGLETLTKYATIISQYPPSYSNESRIFHWVNWLSEISSDFSLLKCQEIIGAFHSRYGNNSIDINVARNSLNVVSKLQTVISTHNAKIVSLHERLRVERLEMNVFRSKCSFIGLEDISAQLKKFVAEHKDLGVKSLACALTGNLASLANRLEKMESAAAAAGDRLADMTSMDGDWFLDEVFTLSYTICELSSLFGHYPEILGNEVATATKLVSSSHQVVSALQELHVHFRSIILPEAMKGLQTDDASVVQCTDALLTLAKNAGTPLNVIVSQLEAQIRCVVMEMEIPHKELGAKLQNLRAQFDALHDVQVEPSGLSPGQMLLLGFNGLFTKLELEFLELVSQSKLLPVPSSWAKVDVIREARKLLAPIFLDKARKLLVDVFFVKRLQTMCEVFTLIKTHATFLKGCHTATDVRNPASVCSDDVIARPVQVFISEFVNKMLLGLPMQTLGQCICIGIQSCGLDVTAEIELKDVGAMHKVAVEDLCRKAVELALRSGQFQQHQLAQVSTILTYLETMCKCNDLVGRLDRNLVMHKVSMQKAQLQLASYQWLNEDILSQSTLPETPSTLISPTRSSVMSELKKNMQSLMAAEPGIGQARERYLSLVNSVEQRLRWAAGANPSVGATLEEFEQLASSVNQLVVGLMKLNSDVASNCESILHFEALRTRTAEALSSDYGFLQLLNICQECCLLTENCTSVVTPLEEKLLAIMPLEKSTVCPEWISSVSNKIADAVGSVQLEVAKRKTILNATSEAIKAQIIKVRGCLSTHHRMMTEIRVILRSLAKYEEQEGEKYKNGTNVRQYLTSYRTYSEQFTQLVKEILVDELTLDSAHSFLFSVASLQDSTRFIYNELLALCSGLDAKAANTFGTVSEKDDIGSSVVDGSKDAEIRSNHLVISDGEHYLSGASPGSQVLSAKSSKAVVVEKKKVVNPSKEAFSGVAEERNLYAVGVWKRVKMKLDGRDPDPSKRSSVPEQVEYIIHEATNPDNLATLYEGWTPWV